MRDFERVVLIQASAGVVLLIIALAKCAFGD